MSIFDQTGSWGTPELGLTEALGKFLGTGTTAQGGSNLIYGEGSHAGAPSVSQTPSAYQTNNLIGPSPNTNVPVPTNNGAILDTTPTPAPSGNTGGGFDMGLYPGWGEAEARANYASEGAPQVSNGEEQRVASAEDIARQQYEQKNRELNTQYDSLMAQLGQQKGEIGTARTSGVNNINSFLEEGRGTVEEAKEGVRTSESKGIGEALRTYQDVGRQNRMMARSLGILGSSAYGDIQARSGESFAGTRADIVSQATQQVSNLDRELVNMQRSATNQISSLEEQYASLMDKVLSDERFTGRERNDALQSAVVERNARINEIKDASAQWQREVDMYKTQVADQLKAANTSAGTYGANVGTSVNNLGTALTAQTAGSFNQPGYQAYTGYRSPSREDEYSKMYSPTGSLSILGALGAR